MPDRRAYATVVARWAVAIGLALAGAYVLRRAALALRSRAAARIVALDFARLEGCLLGLPTPRAADAADRAFALALGTGDPIWPHTCAPALTRLSHTADDVATDAADGAALARAATRMETALGEAVFWTQRVQAGQRPAPAWLGGYAALRREVASFVVHHGGAMLPAEAPRQPRVPRAADAPSPVPTLVALPGGDEADLVDARATGEHFAVALRDRRSRYAVCRLGYEPDAQARCAPLELPLIADPRYAGFVPSARGAYLAVWGRAPHSLRGLVEPGSQRISVIAAGNPDAGRDYWVARDRELALQIDAAGAALLSNHRGMPGQAALPASLDVLTDQRALVGTARGAAVVWLDATSRSRPVLRMVPLGPTGDRPGAPAVLQAWRGPRMAGTDRRLFPCAVPGGGAYVVVGDDHGVQVFASENGTTMQAWPEHPGRLDAASEVVCDDRGVDVVARRDETLRPLRCAPGGCTEGAPIAVHGATGLARSNGALLIADAGGPGQTARVRRLTPDGAALASSALRERAPAARAVRIAANGPAVALFVAASVTYALRSADGGASFVPAVVAP